MKMMKKLAGIALAMVMALALMAPAFAATADEVPTTGSITINNAVKGETYTIVKLFNAKVSANGGVTYEMPDGAAIPEALRPYFTWNDSKQTIEATHESLSEDALSALKAWAEANKSNGEKEVADGSGKVEFTSVDLGYYVILSTVGGGASIAVDSTNPNAVIFEKNADNPGFHEGDGKTVGENKTYAVGEEISYTIQYTTVNWLGSGEDAEQVTKYTIEDNLANGALALVGKITVKVLDKDGNELVDEDGNKLDPAASFTFDDFDSIVINWVDEDSNSLYPNNAKLVVTYTAKVTQIVESGVANTVTITVNSTPAGTSTETIYTGSVSITKEDGKTKDVLAGAEFALYKYDENGTKLYRTVAEDSTVGWDADVNKAYIVETDGDGKATIEGVSAGTYYLEETKAPAGYNRIDNAKDGAEEQMKVVIAENLEENVTMTVSVANFTGAELPSTGGIGTTIFYVVGSILVVGAAILLITKKRMGSVD